MSQLYNNAQTNTYFNVFNFIANIFIINICYKLFIKIDIVNNVNNVNYLFV